jgi:sugar phosphate isomerase/epimerase
MNFKIAIQLASIPRPFDQALHIARRLGVGAVELEVRSPFTPRELSGTGRRQLRKILSDVDLKISCLSLATRQGYHVAENLERRVAATKDSLELAHALGTNLVVNRIGCIPEDQADPARSRMVDALIDIGKHGQRCGAFLAAQTGSEPGPVLADLIQGLPEGTLLADLDPASLISRGYSVEEAVTSLGRHVAHVRARDAVYDRRDGRGQEVPLGRGVADFPRIAATLDVQAYRGYFTIERRSHKDILIELDDAVAFLRTLQHE